MTQNLIARRLPIIQPEISALKRARIMGEPLVDCMWKTGSSNKETGVAELPQRCKQKDCDGRGREDLCQEFIGVEGLRGEQA